MWTISRLATMSLIGATLGAGCLGSDDADEGWAAFRDASAREVDGRTIYIVEWDRAMSLDELRAYYHEHQAAVTQQSSTVQTVGGADDVWQTDAAQHLTYCVTDDFPAADKLRAIDEVH